MPGLRPVKTLTNLDTMPIYRISWIEEIEYKSIVEADSLEDAKRLIGNHLDAEPKETGWREVMEECQRAEEIGEAS